jgi:phage baseplate assembly protein W
MAAPLAYPFAFDGRGRTSAATSDEHVRDLVVQVLFTAPGERVNRPTFGSEALTLVFAPSGDTLAAATRLVVQGALQQWLGDVIAVGDVAVGAAESTLTVTVAYVVRATGEQRQVTLTHEAAP